MTTTDRANERRTALNALTELHADARKRADRAERESLPYVAQGLRKAASTLDRARTRLICDGDHYLDAAWGFVDGGRTLLANYDIQSAVIRRQRRADAKRAEAVGA